jgi:hypothetical protein
MDAVTAFTPRRQDATVSPIAAESTRTLAVTATYHLSEDGRKASLLAGGDGRAVQQLSIEVPVNRLHLVNVDAEGVARLKLRPRYELNALHQVVRSDEAPTYDAPPSLEDLFRDAARNHQLERTYQVERQAAKTQRRTAGEERRIRAAEAFLADPTQRAIVHPAPTPTRCVLATESGRIAFDATRDPGVARNVPAEAHRRFRADLRSRRERNLQERAAQLALHDEKKRVLAEWIDAHGTPEQQARQAAGVLPMDEAIEALTDHTFASLGDRPRYVHDGAERLQAHLHQKASAAPVAVSADIAVSSTIVQEMTASQWAAVNDVRARLPEATVALRAHKISTKKEPRISMPPVFSLLVTQRVGLFTVRREYAFPEG